MQELFDGELKGEMLEILGQLDSPDLPAQHEGVRRVIAHMRAGENVIKFFPSMIRCAATGDIEVKRLVYLYLVRYASQQSEESIMAVNTFVKDSVDGNPIIRALAIRTMCRIHVENISEYLITPLKRALDDQDDYVRKTAAMGVAKLYDSIPEMMEESGIIDALIALLYDSNPMVVTNSIMAIVEINSKRSSPIFEINDETIDLLTNALASASEEVQTLLLDAISTYVPTDSEKASMMIDRFTPYLKKNNPSVILSAFRCICNLTDDVEFAISPIVSLVQSSIPEVQYVVLNALKQHTKFLKHFLQVFFCRYNDAPYVKLAKLEILVDIVEEQNAVQIIGELSEYSTAVDVPFVRKAIRGLGTIALRVPASASRIADIIIDRIKGPADYAVEECALVLPDLLRAYPDRFESIIGALLEKMDDLTLPASRASAIWIIGEYCKLIDNSNEFFEVYVDGFKDEAPEVQLQMITAAVKLFLVDPENNRDTLQTILTTASSHESLPDIRNKAIIYWRMLSANEEACRTLIFQRKSIETRKVVKQKAEIGTFAGILGLPNEVFLRPPIYIAEHDMLIDINTRVWNNVHLVENVVEIEMDWSPSELFVKITNLSEQPVHSLAIAMNKNPYGLTLTGSPSFEPILQPGDSAIGRVRLQILPYLTEGIGSGIQFALRLSNDVIYFTHTPIFHRFISPGLKLLRTDYLRIYENSHQRFEFSAPNRVLLSDSELAERRVTPIARSENEVCFAFKLWSEFIYLADVEILDSVLSISIIGDPQNEVLIRNTFADSFCQSN